MADREIEALGTISSALEGLEPEAVKRVIDWAAAKHGITLASKRSSQNTNAPGSISESDVTSEFASFPDLYDAASPKTEPERVLVVAYWLQQVEGTPEWASQAANDLLKDLGHPVSNIARTLGDMQKASPRLAMQTQKSGKTKQARKLYKLTVEGVKKVKAMIAGGAVETPE